MIHFIHRKLKLDGIVSRFFFWVIIIVFLTSLSYLFTYGAVDRKVRLEAVKEDLQYGLSNQRITLENWSADRMEELTLLASLPVTKDENYEAMASRYNYYGHYYEQLNAIVYIDKDGYVRLDTALDDTIITDQTINVADRHYFESAKNGEEVTYNIVEKTPTGEGVVVFSAPVLTDYGEFNGVLLTVVHLNKIIELLSETIQGDSGKITLATYEGDLILQLTKDMHETFVAGQKEHKINGELLHHLQTKADQDFLEYKSEENEKIYSAISPLLNEQFMLVNEIDKQEILASHNQIAGMMFVITMLIVIIALTLIYPVSRRLLQPFHYIELAIDEMRVGRYNTQLDLERFSTSPREFQQIMHVFNEMAVSIQENKALLQQLSNTDGLTGIANRRYFEEKLTEQWKYSLQEQQPISLLFIDIDYFKKYNDSFGHQEGDAGLIKIAQALSKVTEEPDQLVARYGGEEFVITLPNVSTKKAQQLAVDVQEEIRRLRIRRSTSEEQKYVTVSIGVATTIPTVEDKKEHLIQLADQALYEAKSQGRNKVIVREK